ncbi:DUF4287 domain-containing protein [Marisediminicola sp. LYQ134]|uniref:DUF4287 domain-containing protein n=1 Tax=unclassified Marisediminicola TaxID=2618316 RepID=UPI003982DB8B
MTFQAYLDTIKSKTGKTPADFRVLAEKQGLLEPGVKPAQIVEWLARDFGLGKGHAMAIVATLGKTAKAGLSKDEKLESLFAGSKAQWRPLFDSLVDTARGFGEVSLAATNTYVSLLKGTAKFAIVQPSASRLDLGIKLPDAATTERFAAAGSWNSMVTHRVGLRASDDLDADVVDWLRRAYERA